MMNIEEVRQQVIESDPNLKVGSKEFQAYEILLSAPILGPFATEIEFVNRVSEFTGHKTQEFQTMCRRVVRNKIVRYGYKNNQDKFLDGEVYQDWIGMALGANIALGFLRRKKSKICLED